MIRTALNGFFMALADSVPGVSGGTIALIMGFYDDFIGSINKIFYGNLNDKKSGISYLLKLFLGWAVGMIIAILALTAFFEKNIFSVSSLFLGFVFPSIFIIAKEEYSVIKNKWQHIPYVILGVTIVACLTYFNGKVTTQAFDMSNFSAGSAAYLFVSGAVAIVAMFLPGISGSTVLLIFGAYLPVITAVKDLLHLNFKVLPMIAVFGFGILFGALVSVKGIQKCLEKFRAQTVMLIIGMLIGSLYAIVMGPTTVSLDNQMLGVENFSVMFFAMGVVLIVVLEFVKRKFEQNKQNFKCI